MKKLGQYISVVVLLGLIGASGYFIYQKSLGSCDKPLEYAIGRFDTQFGISQNDFKSYIAESSSVWEKVLNRKVFVYNKDAKFKINLIYDERQLTTIQKQKTEFGLSVVEATFKQLDADFNAFKNQYDQKVSVYESELASYKNRKSAYDAEVASWNSRGGASPNKFQSLETERQYLNTEVTRLNAETSSINSMTKELNTLLNERNAKAVEYNKIAQDYNKKYNGGLEFNQAEYVSPSAGKAGAINVYQFGNKKDLGLALTHELGHALGMDHVENPKSIMYYITGINAETSPTPTAEDLAELKKVCKI
jgi:hypothetical protein